MEGLSPGPVAEDPVELFPEGAPGGKVREVSKLSLHAAPKPPTKKGTKIPSARTTARVLMKSLPDER